MFQYRKVCIELKAGDPIGSNECEILNQHAREGWRTTNLNPIGAAPAIHGGKPRLILVIHQERVVPDDVAGKKTTGEQRVSILGGDGLPVKEAG